MIRSIAPTIALALVMIAGFALPAVSTAQDSTVTYQGQLRLDGEPFTGTANLDFRLFDQLVDGSEVGGPQTRPNWPVEDGLFQVELDFGSTAFDGGDRFLEVRVDGAPLSPRQRVTATPYAVLAAGAAAGSIDGVSIDPTEIQLRVVGTCPAGEYVREVNQDGTVICESAAGAGGTVTQVDTGAGLTGGPITDTGAISVASGGIGATQINPGQVQRRVTGTCPAGQSIRLVNQNGSVVCEVDDTGDATGLWSTSGNAPGFGAFLGTTNAEPLELRAADRTVMRILDAENSDDNHAPNLIAGSQFNQLDQSGGAIAGATIAGGGGDPTQTFCGPDGTSPCVNTVSANYATVLGGYGNYATSFAATAIGRFATASGDSSTAIGGFTTASGRDSVAMGDDTEASGSGSTAMGSGTSAEGFAATAMGVLTTASGSGSTAMGRSTTASGIGATAMGTATLASGKDSTALGASATASGSRSTAMGFITEAGGNLSLAAGYRAEVRAEDSGTFIWADSQNADFVSTGPNQFLIRAAGGLAINTNTPRAPLTVRGEGKWNPDIGNGFGDFHVGNEDYGLAIGVANGPGLGAGAVRFWPKGGNEAIVFTTGDSYPDRTLTLSDNRLVGVRRNPVSNALEVAGNASKSSAGSWLANSDARIKTDVEGIPGALDRLMRVRPVTFRYSQAYRDAHPDLDETRYYNVIAQEFARVFPDAVKGSGEFLPGRPQTPDNEILQVDTHPALITSVAAVQELAVRLEQAEARNAALEAGLSELRTELAMLRERVVPRVAEAGVR
jgi:trimeric autotransporter adhesin